MRFSPPLEYITVLLLNSDFDERGMFVLEKHRL